MPENTEPAAAELHLEDAVLLATALSHHIAHRAGIRALILKGPLAAAQGLREQRQSQDVDVLVDPARFDDLLAAFAQYGWIPRPTPGFPLMLELHSRTLVHPGWNCDIDVHHYWPGFIGEAGTTFDHVWQRRQSLSAAGVEVDTTGRADTVLVLALHTLREAGYAAAESRKMRDYTALLARVRDDEALACAVLACAHDTGALQTARPFLLSLGFDVPEDAHPSEALRRWRLHAHARHRMTAWLLELRGASFTHRVHVIRRAVFPTADELRAIDPAIGRGARAVIAGWWRRLSRGVRSAPQAIHDLRAHYRSR
ncbi:nucleotidyltransferase family protein [Cryobacterium sp. 1639]|uniref:nucleotidyltransferase family protein n=1 Tax=Cryobacterium inferilacus TaxID=2866629 RepID=UPI001C72CF87|nr:nucleotidyltransferase family protein [Cryobacterium sp. 1639]MBX0301315.1 nucleotidyltransferase family protein [Cryobacterium sp. 1639]